MILCFPKTGNISPSYNVPLSIIFPGEFFRKTLKENVKYYDLRTKSEEDFLKDCEKEACVGFSVMIGQQCSETIRLVKKIKNINKNIKIIIGGSHIRGDFVINQLLDTNLFYKIYSGGVGEDLNFFDLCNSCTDDLFLNGTFQYITSWGCAYNKCSFCCVGENYRERDLKIIEKEIPFLKNRYNIKHVVLTDPFFGGSYSRQKTISELLKQHNITWHCNTRVNNLSEKIIKLFNDNNMISVELGVESGSQYVLDNILKKGIKKERIKQVINNLKCTNISPMLSFMYGFGESKNQLFETCDFVDELILCNEKIRISFFKYSAFPEDNGLSKNYIFPEKFEDWKNCSVGENDSLYYIVGLKFRKDNLNKRFGNKTELAKPFVNLANILWEKRELNSFPVNDFKMILKKIDDEK